jgi:hypothetical protein
VLLLFYRYAEPASAAVDNSSGGGAPNGQSALPQKVPGTTYKTHLHALWRLLSDAEPELLANGGGIKGGGGEKGGARGHLTGAASTSSGGGAAEAEGHGGEGADKLSEASRRALLGGVFTAQQFLDSAFSS